MPLLADYALTPDVFDVTSYSSEEVCGLHLQTIREALLTEGLVRDLRRGEWRQVFSGDHRSWHRRAKELFKKLATQGRLIPFEPVAADPPVHDHDWCTEALGTNARRPFTGGVIVTGAVKALFSGEPLVAPIDRLGTAPWWAVRSPSATLARTIADYRQYLDPVLRCANSILFIDPHLDPERHGYREFGDLLEHAGRRTPAPEIEIHRVCYERSGRERQVLEVKDLERDFRTALAKRVHAAGLRVEVFVWDDFHDRFLISNLIGISLPNGFDTTAAPRSITRWTRLGRDDRDDVQREFHPASRRHALRGHFTIP